MTSIKIYQSYYLEKQIKTLDGHFIPYDVSNNPHPEFRETPVLIDLYNLGYHKDSNYTGFFSHKFNQKSKLSGKVFLDFIRNNPGYDLYILNPFPQIAYQAFNVWEQGEAFHTGIAELADTLFKHSGLKYRTETTGRNKRDTLSYSNYWAGNNKFWNFYIPLLQDLYNTIQDMPFHLKVKYTKDTYHSEPCVMAPFIFERILSTVLKHEKHINFIAYDHSFEEMHNTCIHQVEHIIIDNFSGLIDTWDKQDIFAPEQRKALKGLTHISAEHLKLKLKYEPAPF